MEHLGGRSGWSPSCCSSPHEDRTADRHDRHRARSRDGGQEGPRQNLQLSANWRAVLSAGAEGELRNVLGERGSGLLRIDGTYYLTANAEVGASATCLSLAVWQ